MDGGRGRGHPRPERPRLLRVRDERRGERRVAAERGDAGVARGAKGRMSTGSMARPALPQALLRSAGARPGRPTRSPRPWTNGRSCANNPSSLARARATSRRPAARASQPICPTAATLPASSKGSWRDPRKAERAEARTFIGFHPISSGACFQVPASSQGGQPEGPLEFAALGCRSTRIRPAPTVF